MIASLAHSRGLAIGLKNDGFQVAALVGDFDYLITESCFDYNECALSTPFVTAGKPVFLIEYEQTAAQFCKASNQLGFNGIQKRRTLDSWVAFC
jgi:hypothetical protein